MGMLFRFSGEDVEWEGATGGENGKEEREANY